MRRDHIILSATRLKKLIEKWTIHLSTHPEKLFRTDYNQRLEECLDLIKRSKGFQITAFAGKAQNHYTHPSRLPDLGDLNLLIRLRAVQIVTKRPIRIIFDGDHYAKIFGEESKYIVKYEKKLKELSALANLNNEFSKAETLLTVNQLLKYLKFKQRDLDKNIKEFQKKPEKAFKLIDMYPEEIMGNVKRIISDKLLERTPKSQLEDLSFKISKNFIIYKAALADIIDLSFKKDHYQRITILRYSGSKNPRINLEMNIAPWNSTILFKNTYLNINTATNGSYSHFLEDHKNLTIEDKNKYFWGFARNRNIFNDL